MPKFISRLPKIGYAVIFAITLTVFSYINISYAAQGNASIDMNKKSCEDIYGGATRVTLSGRESIDLTKIELLPKMTIFGQCAVKHDVWLFSFLPLIGD